MIEAFANYVINVYPRGINACQTLDLVSICMIKGQHFMEVWPGLDALQVLNAYKQTEEKEAYGSTRNWQATKAPDSTLTALFT
jgi:hypothetical protein